MRSLSSSMRRGLAAIAATATLALSASACGMLGSNSSSSDSDACGKGGSGGNVTQCFGISDLGSSKGDAVVPAGTSVTIVCNDGNGHVGIIVPKGIVNADMSNVEWKTKGGANAVRGISTDYFSSVPKGLPSCDSALKSA